MTLKKDLETSIWGIKRKYQDGFQDLKNLRRLKMRGHQTFKIHFNKEMPAPAANRVIEVTPKGFALLKHTKRCPANRMKDLVSGNHNKVFKEPLGKLSM